MRDCNCDKCNGLDLPEDTHVECPVEHWPDRIDGDWVVGCDVCGDDTSRRALGTIHTGEKWITCPTCDGRGWHVCDLCDGTGSAAIADVEARTRAALADGGR